VSKTVVLPPIDVCFEKAEGVIKPRESWRAMNELQLEYLKNFLARREDLRKFSEKELRSWVSKNAGELNAILKTEGFNIKFNPFKSNEFGAVSILDVLVEWLVAGKVDKIYWNDEVYPAVSMDRTGVVDDKHFVAFDAFEHSRHKYPVVVLETKSGDKIGMTIAGRPFVNFELVERINAIRDPKNSRKRISTAKKLLFPMIDLDQEEDITWLAGMCTVDRDGDEWYVGQALQQTKFKMNEKGARVKSAAAISVILRSASHQSDKIIIDRPFLLWVERRGLSQPLMYAYLDEADWKSPGDLGNI